jgi:hypothetical protein
MPPLSDTWWLAQQLEDTVCFPISRAISMVVIDSYCDL